jgi:hypothetical protein
LAEISKYLKNPELLPNLTVIDAKTLCSSGDIERDVTPQPKPFNHTILDLVSVSFKTASIIETDEAGDTSHCYVDTSDIERRRQAQYLILKKLAAGTSNLTVAL